MKHGSPKRTSPKLPRFRTDGPMRWFILPSEESDPSKMERALRERIKELNCLYGITRLAESGPDSLEEFLRRVANILPPSWQYPEITCARITFDGTVYKTGNFKSTRWRQSSDVYST